MSVEQLNLNSSANMLQIFWNCHGNPDLKSFVGLMLLKGRIANLLKNTLTNKHDFKHF